MPFEIDPHVPAPPVNNLSFKVSTAMREKMDRHAKDAGIGISALARQMVEHCLAELDAKAAADEGHH